MKKIIKFLGFLKVPYIVFKILQLILLPLSGLAQIEIENVPVDPIVIPGEEEDILSVRFHSERSSVISKCWLYSSDVEQATDYFYLYVPNFSSSYLSFNQEGFTEQWSYLSGDSMIVYPHTPTVLVGFEEESVLFEYKADFSEGINTESLRFCLYCSVYPYGQNNSTSYTNTICNDVPVYVSVENASKPSGVLVHGNRIFIPKGHSVQVRNLLGQWVLDEPLEKQLQDRWEYVGLPTGVYFIEIDEKYFGGKFMMASD